MKLRLTLGNMIGGVLAGAAWIAGHSDVISQVVPKQYSVPLLGIAAGILFFAKGATTKNADLIPEDKKAAENSAVVIEKTTPLYQPK